MAVDRVAEARAVVVPQAEAASVVDLAASEGVADEAVPWFWAAAAADMTSIVRTVRSTTLSATLPWMPRLTLLPTVRLEKASYIRQRFGVSLGGPLNIPKVYNGGSKTFFFLNYNGSRGSSPYDAFSFVPTPDERSGNFSGLSGVQLINPNNGQPIPNNILQNAGLAIDPIAQGLLKFIPLPNVVAQLPMPRIFIL